MIINFHNVTLPDFISTNIKGGPVFSTSLVRTSSGREVRSSDRLTAIHEYSVEKIRLSKNQFDIFNAFFMARLGRKFAFKINDFSDNTINLEENIEIKNNSAEIEIYKKYHDLINPYHRRIILLNKEKTIISINGNAVDSNFIDFDKGILKLGYLMHGYYDLKINAQFYVPVRFVNDALNYSVYHDGSIVVENIKLTEVFGL